MVVSDTDEAVTIKDAIVNWLEEGDKVTLIKKLKAYQGRKKSFS